MKTKDLITIEPTGCVMFDGEYYSVLDTDGELIAEYDNQVEADLHLLTLGDEDEYKANDRPCGHDEVAQD